MISSICGLKEKASDLPKSVWYAAGGIVAVVGAVKLIRRRRQQALESQWASAGIDVVVLHQFRRAFHCPNASPYCLKLETYLRMANIDYVIDNTTPMGALGKSPWITFNGKAYADSELIIEMLGKKLQIDLSRHLEAKQRSEAKALQIVIEEHFIWPFAIDRYMTHSLSSFFEKLSPNFFEVPHFMLKLFLDRKVRGMVKDRAEAQGMGRHDLKTTTKIGLRDLEIVSDLLGDRSYLTGEMPTEADCAVFAVLAQVLFVSHEDSPFKVALEKDEKLAKLKAYTLRMKEKYWRDWDKIVSAKTT